MKDAFNHHMAKYITILYGVIIIGWIITTAIMQGILYPVENDHESIGGALDYYQDHRGYIGLDHGTKGLVFLISSIVPLMYLKFSRSFRAMVGSFFGSISFILLSLSFLVQAFTAEFVISMLTNPDTRSMAEFVYEWIFLEGGITYSTYFIVNVLIGAWVILHSLEFKKLDHTRFFYYGIIVGLIHILSSVFLLLRLIIPNDIGVTLTDVATFLFIVWFIMYGFKLDRLVRSKGH